MIDMDIFVCYNFECNKNFYHLCGRLVKNIVMRRILSLMLLVLFIFLFFSSCENKSDGEVHTVKFVSDDVACGTISGSTEQTLAENEVSEWVMAVPNSGFSFLCWSDGVKEIRREGETFKEDVTITAFFGPASAELPIIRFDMPSGDEVTSKTEYVPITVSISKDGEYILEGESARVRGRGNASWKYMEKKSYRLKFDEKIHLLETGSGAARDWVLISNHFDQSMLRNYIASWLGRELDGLEYTTDTRFVELFINSDYKGVYLLCEQVEVDEQRVNIEIDPNVTDTGYLIELDRYSDVDEGNKEDETYFRAGEQLYSLKSDVTPEQVRFIKEYVEKTDAAIRSGDREEIEKYIDLKSCIDMYLLQEYMMNIDVGWSSFFMYRRQGGKLFFGPAWDFDHAAGNDYRLNNGKHDDLYIGNTKYDNMPQYNQWLRALMQTDWFRAEVKTRWNETRSIFERADEVAEAAAEEMKLAVERNFERWPILGQRINVEPDIIASFKSYSSHRKYLVSWLDRRFIWLDNYFMNEMK